MIALLIRFALTIISVSVSAGLLLMYLVKGCMNVIDDKFGYNNTSIRVKLKEFAQVVTLGYIICIALSVALVFTGEYKYILFIICYIGAAYVAHESMAIRNDHW